MSPLCSSVLGRRARVVVGLSGGVDSTLSAILLKKKGYQVTGAFMRNWDLLDETGHCSSDMDAQEAQRICAKLQIPFREVNLVKEYWSEVFDTLVSDYGSGLTPNPDVDCNTKIKFAHFHRFCLEEIGCDAVATGHYARNSYGEDLEYSADDKQDARLLKAVDTVKDQTFFLSRISQQSLRRALFPVGNLTKSIVKQLVAKEGFPEVAQKPESMGICFIGKRSFQNFISEYIQDKPGDIVDVDDGSILGRHKGLHHWTVGQRLPVGMSTGSRRKGYTDIGVFVVDKDEVNNRLIACADTDHPALYCENFRCIKPQWIRSRPPEEFRRATNKHLECEFRFQNVQPLTNCVVTLRMMPPSGGSRVTNHEALNSGYLTVSSAEPKRAVTPGQYVAFYKGDECLGSAIIERAGPSLLTMSGSSSQKKTS